MEKEYAMWDRGAKYLSEIGFHTSVENCVPTSRHKKIRPSGKGGVLNVRISRT